MANRTDVYTNVVRFGNNILYSGYNTSTKKRIRQKVNFEPVLYKESPVSQGFRSLENGNDLTQIQFQDINQAQNYSNSNKSTTYGLSNFALQFISKYYQDVDASQINPHYGIIDIEVYTAEPKYNKKGLTKWSTKPNPSKDDIHKAPLSLLRLHARKNTIYVKDENQFVELTQSKLNKTDSTGFPDPSKAKEMVNAITLYSSEEDIYYVYGLYCEWDTDISILSTETTSKVVYQSYDRENNLLTDFINKWYELDFDIITGWNSEKFDIPFLYNRIKNKLGEVYKKLSPWNVVKERWGQDKFKNKTQYINIVGMNQLDYLDLFEKYTFDTHANYKLDTIAYDELNVKKIDYSEAKSLFDLYDTNQPKFIDYNIKDVGLIKDLNDKHRLIDLIIDIAYFSGINFDDTFSPVKIWDTIIYRHLYKKGLIPKLLQNNVKEKFLGAYCKPPIATNRLFKWITSFDLASEYPSIIRQFNIGPDTYRGTIGDHIITDPDDVDHIFVDKKFIDNNPEYTAKLQENNLSLAANGTLYDITNQSFLSELVEWLYGERSSEKKLKLKYLNEAETYKSDKIRFEKCKLLAARAHTRQLALKILLNSLYGALGNIYFRYYDLKFATAVTCSGRVAIKWAANDINEFLINNIGLSNKDRVIAIDTDSVYVDLEDLVDMKFTKEEQLNDEQKICDWLDKFAKKFTKNVIDKSYQNLCDRLNCREQLMIMDREVIASTGFWTSKKHYAMRVLDLEGVRKTKYKVLGLETQQGGTPEVAKEGLMNVIDSILTLKPNEDIINIIDSYRSKYETIEYDEICLYKSCKTLSDYEPDYSNNCESYPIWPTGTPGHVRGAIVYNNEVLKNNLQHQYDLIRNGDTIKLLQLKEPNPFHCKLIAYKDFIPEEISIINNYIDRDKQYMKTFYKPAESMCHAAGLNAKEQEVTIADLFG